MAKFAAFIERPKAVLASEGFAPDPLTKGSAMDSAGVPPLDRIIDSRLGLAWSIPFTKS